MTDRGSEVFEIRAEDDSTAVRMSVADAGDAYVMRLAVEVESQGLKAVATVAVDADHGLAEFLGWLNADWRGWDGVRTWGALDPTIFGIEATHLGRAVEFAFVLRKNHEPDAWEVRGVVRVPSGETLATLAATARRLTG
jgi:hypothetical protein